MSDSWARACNWSFLAFLLLAFSEPVLAYAGPGAGLTMIGSLLALVGAALAGIYGFVWYPLKRIFKRRKQGSQSTDDE